MQMGGPPHAALRRAARNGVDGDTTVDRALVRRVWGFARPSRRRLLLFLVTVTAGALIALAPPLLFKQIIDNAIPNHDRGLVTALALIALVLALVSTALDVAQRYWSAIVGEGLSFDLRSALYDHVQRMPLAFFTRT